MLFKAISFAVHYLTQRLQQSNGTTNRLHIPRAQICREERTAGKWYSTVSYGYIVPSGGSFCVFAFFDHLQRPTPPSSVRI